MPKVKKLLIRFKWSFPKAFLLLNFVCLPSLALPPEAIYRQASDYVFSLEVTNKENEIIGFRSATLIKPQQVVSECDFFSEDTTIKLRRGTIVYPARLLHQDVKRNLCLLEVNNISALPPLTLAATPIKTGNRIYAIGNSLNIGLSISEGIVSAVREKDNIRVLQHTASIAPGSEGGALMDEEGKLIGIVRYQKNDGQNINFSIPLEWLNEIPSRANAQLSLRAWQEKAAKLKQAAKWTELAKHAQEHLPLSKLDAEVWQTLGYAEQLQKNHAAAEIAYLEAIKLNPEDMTSLIEVGFISLHLNKPQQTLDIAKKLTYQFSNEGIASLLTYFAESALAHRKEANEALEKASQLLPWNEYVQELILNDAYRINDLQRALRASWRLTQINSSSPKNWTLLSESYLRLNKPTKSLSVIEKALKLSPNFSDAFVLQGRALAEMGRYQDAIKSIKNGIANDPSNPSYAWFSLANIQYEIGLYPEAVLSYREAIRLDPNNKFAANWLIFSLRKAGHFVEAKTFAESAKSKRPTDIILLQQLAFSYNNLSENQNVIDTCEQALKIDPKQPLLWATLVETYHRMGKREDVKRAYQRLLDLDRNQAEQTYKNFLLPYEDVK